MELSPLAREKLARIGELTEEEKTEIRYSQQLAELLARYFTDKITPEGLWKELQEHRNAGRIFMLRDTQLMLLKAINLSSSDTDLDKLSRGILAVETLKEGGDYTGLEYDLKSLGSILHQYREEKDKSFGRIKADVERKVKIAAQQLAQQAAAKGAAVDVQGSVEASTKASPEWKSFVTRHESIYNQKLKDELVKVQKKVNKWAS